MTGDKKKGFTRHFLGRCKHDRAGFTLLEVITATVILAILAAGIFSTLSFSKRMAIRAHQKMIAISVIEAKLNELKLKGPREIDVTSVPAGGASELCTSSDCVRLNDPVKFNPPINDLDSPTIEAVRNTEIRQPDLNNPGVKEVRVSVSWRDTRGAPMTEAVVTYLYDAPVSS